MSTSKKRIYISETRNAQAKETRERILLSAKKLLQLEGFEFMTVEKLAKAAKVSAPTIYSLFKSKRGVMLALMDESFPLDRYTALLEELKSKNLAKDRLAIAAKITREMYDAERAQIDIFRGAVVLAPEFKELEKEREQRRYQRQEESTKITMEDKAFLEELSLSKVRDILWAFTGRDMYRMFVVERGWSSDEYEVWLTQLLIKTLLKNDS